MTERPESFRIASVTVVHRVQADLAVDGSVWTMSGFISPMEIGRDPSDAMTTGVTATLTTWLACLTNGDPLSVSRLFTDAGLQRLLWPGDPWAAGKTAAAWLRDDATPPPLDAFVIRKLRHLSDTEAIAILADDPDAPLDATGFLPSSLWFFVDSGHGWRIEAIVGGLLLVSPVLATPGPMRVERPT